MWAAALIQFSASSREGRRRRRTGGAAAQSACLGIQRTMMRRWGHSWGLDERPSDPMPQSQAGSHTRCTVEKRGGRDMQRMGGLDGTSASTFQAPSVREALPARPESLAPKPVPAESRTCGEAHSLACRSSAGFGLSFASFPSFAVFQPTRRH